MDRFLERVVQEWDVISQAPITFVTAILVLGSLIYIFLKSQFRDRLASEASMKEALEERLKLRDDQLAALKLKLENTDPDRAATMIEEMRNQIAALQPYGLSPKKAEAMLEVLSKSKAKTDVLITQEVTAPDAIHLFEQVSDIFEKAGWSVTKVKGTYGIDEPPDCGVTLIWRNYPEDSQVIANLKHAFNVAGLDIDERDETGRSSSTTCPQISFSSRDPNYVPMARWA